MRSPSGLVDSARAAVAELGELDLDGLGAESGMELLRSLSRLSNMVQAQLTRAVGVVHAHGWVRADGALSTQAWLSSMLRTADAGRHVQAARTLAVTPEVAAAYERGDISLAHVAQVSAVVDDIAPEALAAGIDKLLAEQACQHTPRVFRQAAERIRDHCDPDAADRRHRDRFDKRWLSVDETFQGTVAVKGVLDPEAGELLINTLAALMPPPVPGDPRATWQRRADALVDLCRLGAQHAPVDGGAKPHVLLTVDLTTLQRSDAHAGEPVGGPNSGQLSSGARVGAETARRIACDASISRIVLGSRGEPLDVGRLTRLIPAAIRRALYVRDGRCRFPGCSHRPQWTDAHHLQPWAQGGSTSVRNLILLCRGHHGLVHEGGFAIRLDHDTGIVRAYYPDGRPLDRPLDLVSPPRSQLP